MKYPIKEKNGFKVIYLPRTLSFQDFANEFYTDEYINDKNSILYQLKTSLIDEKYNSFYAGYYFIKNTEKTEYFILCSHNRVGVATKTKLEDGSEEKSMLYETVDKEFTLRWNHNDKSGSTHESRRYASNGYQSFQDGELEGFLDRLFSECYECEGLEKIINIDELREEIYRKTNKTLS